MRKGGILSLINPWSATMKKYGLIKNEVPKHNLKGEGMIFGGLYVMKPGRAGVQYQHMEQDYGDASPFEEIMSAVKAASAASSAGAGA